MRPPGMTSALRLRRLASLCMAGRGGHRRAALNGPRSGSSRPPRAAGETGTADSGNRSPRDPGWSGASAGGLALAQERLQGRDVLDVGRVLAAQRRDVDGDVVEELHGARLLDDVVAERVQALDRRVVPRHAPLAVALLHEGQALEHLRVLVGVAQAHDGVVPPVLAVAAPAG